MPSLQFKGKTFVDNHHLAVPFRELRPVDGKGTGKPASLHDNLIIHGDNLAALKALLPTDHYRITFCQLPFQIYQAIDALADRGTQHGT